MNANVTTNFTATLLHLTEGSIPLPSALGWNEDSPLIVDLLMFNKGDDEPTIWHIGRDLLKDAVSRDGHHGEMDVEIVRLRTRPVVLIHLSSDSGNASIELPLMAVRHFLEETESHVPVGTEDLSADLESALAVILAGG